MGTTLAVTISYGDRCDLPTPPTITLNGQNVTSQFTYTGGGGGTQCTGASGQATGTITLLQGVNTLSSSISNANLLTGADTVTYSYVIPVHKLRITVAYGATHGTPGSRVSVPFTVTNIGNTTDTVYTKNHCNGAALNPPAHCFTSPDSSFGMVPGATYTGTAFVDLGTTVGSTGRLETIAYEKTRSTTDTAYTDITVQNPLGAGVVLNTVTGTGTTVPREKCLTIEIRPGVAYQCGDLRVVLAVPAVRTYNELRTPHLVYHSNIGHGHTALGALVTFDSTKGTPDTVKVTVVDSATGATVGSGKWLGSSWVKGATQRVTVNVDESNTANVRWAYTFTATAIYNAAHTTQSFSAIGAEISVSQVNGSIGELFMLAGVEHLVVTRLASTPWTSTPPLLWYNTEGDTRQYNPVPGDSNVWAAAGVDRPDTIKHLASDGFLHRYAEHGGQVVFNATGNELTSIDRLGHVIQVNAGNLNMSAFTVPSPSGGLTYTYKKNSNGSEVDTIIAPANGSTARKLIFGYDAIAATDTVYDLDGSFEVYHFTQTSGAGAPDHLLTSYQDKRATKTTFHYDSAFKLIQAIVDSGGASHLNLTWTFLPAESRGLTTPVSPDSAYTLVTGPRANAGDSADVSRFWVDQWGEPFRLRDAHGYEIELTRGNATYPALVTYARFQNGHVVTETYDRRGNDSVTVDSTHAGAATQYTFDQTWDFVTKIVKPAGDQTSFAYDATDGNLLYVNPGPDTTRRVHFNYYPSNDAGSNLVASVTQPIEGPPGDSVYYDSTLGNAKLSVTPKGFATATLTDAIGRVVRTRSPIDSLNVHAARDSTHHRWRTDTIGYDILDRVVLKKSYGPPDTSDFSKDTSQAYGQLIAQAETTVVKNYYDPRKGGVPDSTSRQALPDINSIGILTNGFRYDSLDRLLTEIWPDGQVENYNRDADGNVILTVTRRGDQVTQTWDALNRVVKRVLPAPPPLLAEVDNYGHAQFTFPTYSNCQVGYCIPGETQTFDYDAVGNLVLATNPTARIRRTYTQYGPISSDTMDLMQYGSPGLYEHTYGLNYTYDADSRRATLVHPANIAPLNSSGVPQQTQSYVYDALGRDSLIVDVLGNTFHFTYDRDGRLQQTAGPGTAETNHYDAFGRLQSRFDSTADTTAAHGFVGTSALNNDSYYYDARGNVVEAAAIQESSLNHYSALGTMVNGLIRPKNGPIFQLDEEVVVADAFGRNFARWGVTCRTLLACDSVGTNTYQLYAPHSERLQFDTNHYNGGLQAEVPPVAQKVFNYDAEGNQYGGQSISNLGALQAGQVGDTNYVLQDWWSAYDDNGHLYAMDRQSCIWDGQVATANCVHGPGDQVPATAETRFEDYYYDALGRRVLLRSRDDVHTPCSVNSSPSHPGCFGAIERFVYDGNEVLYEIRMPGDDSVSGFELERDTGGVATYLSAPSYFALFGRVAYTNGLSLDHPLDLIRMGYDTVWPGPVAIVPHVNWRGVYDLGTFISPNAGAQYQCKNLSDKPNGTTCVFTAWPARRFGYWGQDMGVYPYEDPWIGDVITGHRDVTNQMYLRNRYFDPETQSFTQEDPIGLAGGLNAYGFAHGDPVNYSDPFGLCPIEKDGVPCTLAFAAAGAGVGLAVGGTAAVVTTVGTLGIGAPLGVAEVGTATVTLGGIGAAIGFAVDTKDAVAFAANKFGEAVKKAGKVIRRLIVGGLIHAGGGLSDEQIRAREAGKQKIEQEGEKGGGGGGGDGGSGGGSGGSGGGGSGGDL